VNILAIGAHFDDVELGCGGSLAKHVSNGDKVNIYIATKSGYKDPDGVNIRSDAIAHQEGLDAARIIGANLIADKFETLSLEFNDAINARLVKIIDELKIDIIYTHFIGDVHHDHIALAQASIHAGRHVPRILMYKSNWYQGSLVFAGNFYIDITDTWEIKRAAILAHKTEGDRTNGKWIEYFDRLALVNGDAIGAKRAEVFQLVKWLI